MNTQNYVLEQKKKKMPLFSGLGVRWGADTGVSLNCWALLSIASLLFTHLVSSIYILYEPYSFTENSSDIHLEGDVLNIQIMFNSSQFIFIIFPYLNAALMPSTKFPLHPTYCLGADNNWRPSRWPEEMLYKDFQMDDMAAILNIGTVAILNIHVAPMPPTKFGLNLT